MPSPYNAVGSTDFDAERIGHRYQDSDHDASAMSYNNNYNYGSGGGYGGQGGAGYGGQGGGGGGGGYGNNSFGNYSSQELHAGAGDYGSRAPRWDNDGAYAPISLPASGGAPRNSLWLEKQQARSKRSKLIIAGIVGVIVLIAIAAGVGIAVSNSNKHNNANASSNSGQSNSGNSTSSGNPKGGVTNSDPNDPSVFDKNPDFHKVFYGMAYTPNGGIMPDCGAKQAEVITDIQLMSQLTDTVRLYGGDCNISALVLNAIKVTKVDMKVYLGNYISLTDDAAYTRQKAAIEDALKVYGADNVIGVTVGNEVMLNECARLSLDNPNDPQVAPAATYIINRIEDTRSSLKALGFNNIKVGNSDAGSYFNTQVLSAAEYGLSNVHPWFAHTTVVDAVPWTWNFFSEQNVAPAAALPNKPEMFLAETGWPTGSKEPEKGNTGVGVGGEASIANLQTFLDEFVCQSNANGIKYFYFELFDEVWKDIMYGGVEGYWGLLDSNKKLKSGIKIPTCST